MFLVAVLALMALALLTSGGGGDGDPSGSPSAGEDRSSSSDSDSGQGSGSTVAPPDVDDPREPVDLAVVPTGDDPVELARWWAATYTAYVGAEVPGALADRLAVVTTDSLRSQLSALPPAASYDPEPVDVEGVSQPDPVPVAGGAGLRIRVSVETAGALSSYDLTLVQDPAGGGWLVDQARRV